MVRRFAFGDQTSSLLCDREGDRMTDDPFALLGLPPSFHVDAEALEQAFLVRARAAHPDFHAQDAAAQERAVEDSSRLNEAYALLKAPIQRAEYLLERLGGPSGADV